MPPSCLDSYMSGKNHCSQWAVRWASPTHIAMYVGAHTTIYAQEKRNDYLLQHSIFALYFRSDSLINPRKIYVHNNSSYSMLLALFKINLLNKLPNILWVRSLLIAWMCTHNYQLPTVIVHSTLDRWVNESALYTCWIDFCEPISFELYINRHNIYTHTITLIYLYIIRHFQSLCSIPCSNCPGWTCAASARPIF